MVFLPSERLLSLYLRGSWNEVICPLEWQLQAEMCSPGQQAAIWVTRCTFSMSGYFHSAAHCGFPLFLVPHYIRAFFFSEMSSGLVLNILGVKHPVFLWVMWPCQWPTAFQNDIMVLNWEWLKRNDYGSLGTSACPFTFQQVIWRCLARSLQMSICFAESRLVNDGWWTKSCPQRKSSLSYFCK